MGAMTDPTQAPSAASRVLDIPELLECILLNTLSPNTSFADPQAKYLLPAQRVNSSFRSCILMSPEIRRRLGMGALNGKDEDQDGFRTISHADHFIRRIENQNHNMEKVTLEISKVNPFVFSYHGHVDFIQKVTLDGVGGFTYRHNYFDPRKTAGPSLVIRFGRIEVKRLRKALKQVSPSWLSMYPHYPTNGQVVLEIETDIPWKDSSEKVLKANMKVKLRPLKELILLAAGFQTAADALEHVQLDYYKGKTEDKVEKFEWKKFFTKEQLKTVVDEPKFRGNCRVFGVQSVPYSMWKYTFQYP